MILSSHITFPKQPPLLITCAVVVPSEKLDCCYLLIKHFDLIYVKGIRPVKMGTPDCSVNYLSNAKVQETHVKDTFKKLQSAEGSKIYSAD